MTYMHTYIVLNGVWVCIHVEMVITANASPSIESVDGCEAVYTARSVIRAKLVRTSCVLHCQYINWSNITKYNICCYWYCYFRQNKLNLKVAVLKHQSKRHTLYNEHPFLFATTSVVALTHAMVFSLYRQWNSH